MKLVAGNSNRPLAEAIAGYLKTPLAKCIVRRFTDMEIFVEVQENVRGEDVFVIQSTSAPANDHLMELLIIIDALRRAKRIDAPLAIVDKRRERPGDSEVMNVIGDVKGRTCILVDDIVDSGGTLVNAAEDLLDQGATLAPGC